MILQHFDREEFINNYWQKKPLLIKHDSAVFKDPIGAEDLAGLACEDTVESRIVTTSGDGSLQLRHGPFDDSTFTRLGSRDWTLLVQAVDQFIPEVDALKLYFNFIPYWRIDDIMVSYACRGGGVGPHYDQYDVFLLQGRGSRRWRLGQVCDRHTHLRPDSELRVIDDFVSEIEYEVETGDILYLPPRIAHHGISNDESLCYSVGFRAPSMIEIIHGYTDMLAAELSEDDRYTDLITKLPVYPGELQEELVGASYNKLLECLRNESAFKEWFGNYVTTPKYQDLVLEPTPLLSNHEVEELIKKESQPIVITKNPSSRFTFMSTMQQLRLFVDGRCFYLEVNKLEAIRKLCETAWDRTIALDFLGDEPDAIELLVTLINQGSLLISD